MNDDDDDNRFSSILHTETGDFSEEALYTGYFINPSICDIPHIFMAESVNKSADSVI